MARSFNLGVGMVAVLEAAEAAPAIAFLEGRGIHAWVMGEVVRT